jgi:hypothetical protein
MAALDGITDYRARGHFAAEIARARGKITELKLQIIQLNQDFGGVPLEVLYDNMKSVVIERNTYGRGVHRFHAGFLDFARHAGFLPRLCQPYRAQTKGKVERFIGYLKGSFWVPVVASMRQAGLKPDKPAANAAVARWLREVANARVHATTNEVPAERLAVETAKLQPLPARYAGRSPRRNASPPVRKAIVGYQHPLSVYEGLMPEALA